MVHIYQKKENGAILLDTLNYTLEEFKANIKGCYPDWDKESMIASEIEYSHPVLDENGELRDKTREERILEGEVELLQDGEYLENEKIIKIEASQDLMRPAWDKKKHIWYESMSRLELIKIRKDKILEYKKIKEEIEALEEFADEFESDETIEISKKNQAKLKEEINNLYKKIKKMTK